MRTARSASSSGSIGGMLSGTAYWPTLSTLMWMPRSGVSGSPRRGLRSRLVSLKAASSAGRIWSTSSLGSHGICAART